LRIFIYFTLGLLMIILAYSWSSKPSPSSPSTTLAPGYGSLAFTAPEAGTYQLPVLRPATDGQVIDSDGIEQSLSQLMQHKVVVLSFIYSTCNDVNGCPLASSVLHRVKTRLSKEPQLADRVRLLTLSFNPEFDTPEVMKRYAQGLSGGNLDWRFLTTDSEQQLQPILEKYKQSRQKQFDENGNFSGNFSHILRVYLIDPQGQIRNIYSVSFLHPDTLINDIKTLLIAPAVPAKTVVTNNSANAPQALYRAGDQKSGYQLTQYTTRSVSLTERVGVAANLFQYGTQLPLGLGKQSVPSNNPLTPAKIQLGRKLFYDRRLSLNNTFSCAMCHIPEQGFTSNEMATAVGVEGRTVRRNSPTLYNVAFAQQLFHDARENTLEQQVWGPLLAHSEMANPSVASVIDKINNSNDYNGLFEVAFKRGPSMETVGMAIASYERTLNSANSAFDQWLYGNNKRALNPEALRGLQLFRGKARCVNCHHIKQDYALFMDNLWHNTGVGYQEAMLKEPDKHRVQVAPGTFIDVETTVVNAVSEQKTNDLGRYEVTQNPKDRWSYKTPTLRNIALTAPYMHNGRFSTLKQVIEFYNQGGVDNENLDPMIQPLGLTTTEADDLVSFLHTLTGDNVTHLVADAFAAPVGEAD